FSSVLRKVLDASTSARPPLMLISYAVFSLKKNFAPAPRAMRSIAWLTGSVAGSMLMLGIGRLHEQIAQHLSDPSNEGVDVHACAQELRVDMEADARDHRERSRRPTREENSDGLGRKPPLPQRDVAANGSYMVGSIVRVSPSPAGRRDETFGDHVSDLALRRAGARREITNVHDRPLSTKLMSKEYGGMMTRWSARRPGTGSGPCAQR